ncbi:TspO/MBR family protein [Clostridium sp.]|uniref:TspO/MBR family protein n=1 Tax=Clostridium sp. TaxID=1506 RepID=UPI00346433A1
MKNIFKVNEKFNLGSLIISILIAEGLGFVAGIFTKPMVSRYLELDKPWFSPPPQVFQIVWPILYLLMGIAAYRIYLKGKEQYVVGSLTLYVIQLLLNFLWPFIFFTFRLYGLSFIEIIILLILIIVTAISFFKKDKISGILMIPYGLWVSYAAVINFFIWMFNEM